MPKEKDKIPDTASASCLSYILEGTSFYFFLPQQCLYFLPEPHGQGSFGYIFFLCSSYFHFQSSPIFPAGLHFRIPAHGRALPHWGPARCLYFFAAVPKAVSVLPERLTIQPAPSGKALCWGGSVPAFFLLIISLQRYNNNPFSAISGGLEMCIRDRSFSFLSHFGASFLRQKRVSRSAKFMCLPVIKVCFRRCFLIISAPYYYIFPILNCPGTLKTF